MDRETKRRERMFTIVNKHTDHHLFELQFIFTIFSLTRASRFLFDIMRRACFSFGFRLSEREKGNKSLVALRSLVHYFLIVVGRFLANFSCLKDTNWLRKEGEIRRNLLDFLSILGKYEIGLFSIHFPPSNPLCRW